MAESRNGERVLRAAGRSEARTVGALLVAAAGLVVLSIALPHPSSVDTAALIVIAASMALAGTSSWFFATRVPLSLTHALIAATAALTGLLIYESTVAAGQFGAIWVWITLVAAYFFSRRVAIAHVAWIFAVNAITLALVPSTAGYSPLTRWLFTGVALTVLLAFVSSLVARRAKADLRARHFFDLSHDMLATANLDGYLVELNDAWTKCLGYSAAELRAVPFGEFVHPLDRERTEAEAANLSQGKGTIGFENRYLARDGTWHWLRWSSEIDPNEMLIYARATDVTALKRIEAEREALLGRVESLARSDALTGLPNRHALDEQLPREMARARRSGSSLCLAIVDIDRFKAYNDEHGHLAGDQLLRECAIAWDSRLRGEDLLVRFGGEEFLVVLPDTPVEQAEEIVERVRAATPGEQTCSAGLAVWNRAESIDELLARADAALYVAKAGGRDLLMQAPPAES